ncbi:tRNA preQ1(34) S-adenosylmethionine ribosyltransferase-isomerase QueA [Spirulina sp. 06S082]|uniref:tRNA preQ1(34) S-adenosylmethionine ribosyltransferase-isomerase QueA n=1 Tax=Spirulina sp. 06S082 TaxID=3110248 RepID=UPI003A4D6825
MATDRLLSSYQYELPRELIAQTPMTPRDRSRLAIVDSPTTHHHGIFKDLPNWLQPGDLLIFNNTRVLPARLFGRKSTGAPVEILLLREEGENCWLALVKPGKRFKIGSEICFRPEGETEGAIELWAKTVDRDPTTGGRLLEFRVPEGHSFLEIVDKIGQIPFPPYITSRSALPEQYQTIYAKTPGAAAAPTAGLHFTEELLQRLSDRGIAQTYITLHVGVGTFRPVEVEDITQHQMHSEWVEVSEETVEKIKQTRAAGGRAIAVGTTAIRALEGVATIQNVTGEERILQEAFSGHVNLFIYPGYQWKIVDGAITNFHLPGSSLLMLISALIGRERLLALYAEAIAQEYRFYSFGDAMLILPEAVSPMLQQNSLQQSL